MNKQAVLNCAFPCWYPRFQSVSVDSCCLELPEEVVQYLLADGVVLPESSDDKTNNESQLEPESDDEVDWSTADTATAEAPKFPEFDSAVKEAIDKLGGAVFPKLDWSSPKDASWVSFDNTLRCSTPDEIYLLLKSSDFVTHDLTEPFKFCTDRMGGDGTSAIKYHLVLREWIHINPAGEFRCFVKDHQLIGISQRHHNSYFPFILAQKEELKQDIFKFFTSKIKKKFTDENFVFDVYVKELGEVILLDFNPFGAVTDPLLFCWEELQAFAVTADKDLVEFRYSEGERNIPPNPYSMYAMPQDFVDLAHGTDPNKLVDFLKLKQLQQDSETDSSDVDTTGEATEDTHCTDLESSKILT